MKISRYQDGSKSIEIATTETDGSSLKLLGDTIVSSINSDTGEESTSFRISEHGSLSFDQRPTLSGVGLATLEDEPFNLKSKTLTMLDNDSALASLVPAQEFVTILYSFSNTDVAERGEIKVIKTDDGYFLDVVSHPTKGKKANIDFYVIEDNGSMLLQIVGLGTGLVSYFKYRINTSNTLYI